MKKYLDRYCGLRRAIICICAYLCVFSLGKLVSLHSADVIFWGGKYFGYNILPVIMFGITVWLFNRFLMYENKRLQIISAIGGLMLSIAIVWGAYAHYVNDIFKSADESIIQIGMILSLNVLCAPIFSEIFLWIDRGCEWFQGAGATKVEKGKSLLEKLSVYFKTHTWAYFLMSWFTIFLCHFPIFLAYWPGNFVFDAKYQMASVIVDSYTTHHPLLHTLLMGKAYQFGQSIGNVSAGYQIYTLLQMLVLSASFAYVLLLFNKKGAKRSFLVASWAFFALFPINPVFAISATKDVLCAAFFLFFMVFLARYIWDRANFKAVSYIGMIISGIFLTLFRNNALYAVLIAAVVIIIFVKGWKERSKLVFVFVAIVIMSKLINVGLVEYTNAWESNTYTETFGIPLQCMARVVDYRKDELEPVLYEEITHYVEEEYLYLYNPYNSDAVRTGANEALLKENTVNFLKLWAKIGLKFPDEYVECIVTNTMGYWYPLNQGYYVLADVSLYHTQIGLGDELSKHSFCPLINKIYDPLFYELKYREVPLLGFFFRTAPYMWLIVFFMLYGVYKKESKILLAGALPVVYIMTCFCGPLAALRYVYCIIVCTPLLIYILLASNKEKQK